MNENKLTIQDVMQEPKRIDQFLDENLGLVHSILKRHFYYYYTNDLYREDFIQLGLIGLYVAFLNYDPSYDVKFSTYAVPRIFGEIRNYMRDKMNPVKVPRGIKDLYTKYVSLSNKGISKEEICKQEGINMKELDEAIHTHNMTCSLESVIISSKDDTTLEKFIGSDFNMEASVLDEYEFEEKIAIIRSLVTPMQMNIFQLRIYHNKSQMQVAEAVGTTQTTVGNFLKKFKDIIYPSVEAYYNKEIDYDELLYRVRNKRQKRR